MSSSLIVLASDAGYIDTILTERRTRGYRVHWIDRLFFGQDTAARLIKNPNFSPVRSDLRLITPEQCAGPDAVIGAGIQLSIQ